jgi:copper chaperone CopZ
MSVSTTTGTRQFQVTGMTCDHCRRAVITELSAIGGVTNVDVDLTSGTVTVAATGEVSTADVAAAVAEAGYTLA